MGDSMKDMYEAEDREKSWRKKMQTDQSKRELHTVKLSLEEIINTYSFTMDEFKTLDQAMCLIMKVTGEKKYW